MSVPFILRAAPIFTADEFAQLETVRHHEMFDRGALKPLPGCEVPILVDHIKGATPIGRVTALRTDTCWTGGTWLWVHAEITDPPGWLRVHGGVSISHSNLFKRDMGGWDLVRSALLNEVSVLSPGVEPGFPRARVTYVGKESPAPGDDRTVAGEIFYGGQRIVRHGIGQVLGVR